MRRRFSAATPHFPLKNGGGPSCTPTPLFHSPGTRQFCLRLLAALYTLHTLQPFQMFQARRELHQVRRAACKQV